MRNFSILICTFKQHWQLFKSSRAAYVYVFYGYVYVFENFCIMFKKKSIQT